MTDRTAGPWGCVIACRHVLIASFAFIPALPVTSAPHPWKRAVALFIGLLAILTIFILLEWRSQEELKQRRYRTVYDSRTSSSATAAESR